MKIKNLHIASIQEVCAADYTSEQIQAWSSKKKAGGYRQAMTVGGERMFVAEVGNRIAGFVSVRHDELHALYIHPKYIKQGIGLALLIYAEKHLKKSGIKQGALRFYHYRRKILPQPWLEDIRWSDICINRRYNYPLYQHDQAAIINQKRL